MGGEPFISNFEQVIFGMGLPICAFSELSKSFHWIILQERVGVLGVRNVLGIDQITKVYQGSFYLCFYT